MASNPRLKRGDIVRTSFAISGAITDFVRQNSMDWAVINTGDRYTRRVPLDSLSLITTCEREMWIKNDAGGVTGTDRCPNRPEIRMNSGLWVCKTHAEVAK